MLHGLVLGTPDDPRPSLHPLLQALLDSEGLTDPAPAAESGQTHRAGGHADVRHNAAPEAAVRHADPGGNSSSAHGDSELSEEDLFFNTSHDSHGPGVSEVGFEISHS